MIRRDDVSGRTDGRLFLNGESLNRSSEVTARIG